MPQEISPDSEYQWSPRFIAFPRVAIFIAGGESQFRLILPGRYLARRSKTLGRWIYRRLHTVRALDD